MSGFKKFKTSDISLVPYVANKQWNFSYNDYPSGSDIKVYKGTKITGSFDYINDPVTEGQYERLVYDSINQLFYQNYTESISGSIPQFYTGSLIHNQTSPYYYQYNSDPNFITNYPTESGDGIRVLSIPKNIYGSKLKPGQFILSSSYYYIKDDGNGNLYNFYTGSRTATVTYSYNIFNSPIVAFIATLPGFNKPGTLNTVEVKEIINNDLYAYTLSNTSGTPSFYQINYSRNDSIQSFAFSDTPTNTYTQSFGPILISGSNSVSRSMSEFLYNYTSIDILISGSQVNSFVGSSPIIINGFPGDTSTLSGSNSSIFLPTSSYNISVTVSYNYTYTGSIEFIGNIFYEHGLCIITNQDYQDMFPLSPLANSDNGIFFFSDNPKIISASRNDIARTGIIDSSSIQIVGGQSQFFVANSDGTISVNASYPGYYYAYYTIDEIYGSGSRLTSNQAKVSAIVNADPTTTTTTTTTTTIPPTFIWVEDTSTCEQDSVFTLVSQVTNLSSPLGLMYDITSSRYYVADADDVISNYYWFDPTVFSSSADLHHISMSADDIYNSAPDYQYRRFYTIGKNTGGMKSLDLSTNLISTVPYGTNASFSRLSLNICSGSIYTFDVSSNTVTIIDRSSLNVLSSLGLGSIPSGSNFIGGGSYFNSVNGEIWILLHESSGLPNIARYNNTLTSFLGSISLSSFSSTWVSSQYWRGSFYDQIHNKYYVYDAGSNNFIVVDTNTLSVIHTKNLTNLDGKTNSLYFFIQDPITGDIFMSGESINNPSDTGAIFRTYHINNSTFELDYIYPNQSFSNLVREGGTNILYGSFPGLFRWNGGAWQTDGIISKFTR